MDLQFIQSGTRVAALIVMFGAGLSEGSSLMSPCYINSYAYHRDVCVLGKMQNIITTIFVGSLASDLPCYLLILAI